MEQWSSSPASGSSSGTSSTIGCWTASASARRCTNRPSRRSRRRRRPTQTIKRRNSSVGIKTASCSVKQTSEHLCKHWTCEDTAKVNQHDEASLDRSQTGKSAPVLQLNAHFDIDRLCVAHFSWLRFSKRPH